MSKHRLLVLTGQGDQRRAITADRDGQTNETSLFDVLLVLAVVLIIALLIIVGLPAAKEVLS